jgi:hypothetical protein
VTNKVARSSTELQVCTETKLSGEEYLARVRIWITSLFSAKRSRPSSRRNAAAGRDSDNRNCGQQGKLLFSCAEPASAAAAADAEAAAVGLYEPAERGKMRQFGSAQSGK